MGNIYYFFTLCLNSRSNMDLLLIKCLQLTLVIANCQLLFAFLPTTILSQSEHTSNEGSLIRIICESSVAQNSNVPNTVSSPASPAVVIPHPNKIHQCADDTDNPVVTNVHNELNTMWLYAYVHSETNPFSNSYHIEGLQDNDNDAGVIPCRLASPEPSALVPNNGKIANILNDSEQRTGFIIKHVAMRSGGRFFCRIHSGNGSSDHVTFDVRVFVKPETLKKPKIMQDPFQHAVQGEELRLRCKADIQTGWDYTLKWTTPQSSDRITIHQVNPSIRNKEGTAIRDLIIRDIAMEDGGKYECTLSASDKSNSTKMFITVHDKNIKFINLTAATNRSHYLLNSGSSVTWVVDFAGNPGPEIRWLDPENRTIISDGSKYIIRKSMSPKKSSLKIFDLQTTDMGIYTVEARSGENKELIYKKVMYNLTVWSKPHLKMVLNENKDYYQPGEEVHFVCNIKAFPKPKITWSFQKFTRGSPEHNSDPEYFQNYTIDDKCPHFHSTLAMKIETSGILTCEAHNEHGRTSSKHSIFVSDVPDGFGIMRPPQVITVGDNVELICGASIYNYTNSIGWDSDVESQELLIDNKKFSITNTQSLFSYRSILHINNIDKSDEQKLFTCRVSPNQGNVRQDEIKLIVNEAREPYTIDVNMNDTEIIYNSETARSIIITLKCHVGGMPPPIISWWKDEQILNATEDLFVFENNEHELQIKHPRISESGEYSCRAKNRLNTFEVHQRIKIHGEEVPKILIISMVILSIICVTLVVYFSIKIHGERITRKKLMEAGLTHFEGGALECLNPELTVDDQAELLPYDKKWEFPKERLKLDKQLGCGAFGVVMKAEATRICRNEPSTTVAVKMVRHSTEPTYIRALSSELKILIHLGKHLNVVNLLGACTRNIAKRELLVIVEYCRFGNLHNYLFRHRFDFINQIDPTTGKINPSIGRQLLVRPVDIASENRMKYADLSFSLSISMNSNSGPDLISYRSDSDSQGVKTSSDGTPHNNNFAQPGWRSNYRGDYKDQNLKPICTQDLLSWAFQVARGMEYLSQRRVLHGDLAARNILLAENNVVKICDFGLAKTMYNDENYEKKGEALLPIKWMAIESIRDRVFSTQSDIWSFGIVLWEFFTLAKTPYPGVGAEKQYQKLIEGYRMEKPEFSTSDIYEIMLECWEEKPSERPTFTDLVQNIGNLLDESVKTHYLELNAPYMDTNTMIFKNGKNDYLAMMSAPDHETLSSRTERKYVNLPNIPVRSGSDCPDKSTIPPNSKDETKKFSSKNISEKTHPYIPLPQPKSSSNCDSELEAVELAPILENGDDNYLKPINIQERRAKFVRERQARENAAIGTVSMERDSSGSSILQNTQLLGIHDSKVDHETNTLMADINEGYDKKKFNNYVPDIITTKNNYINMPNHKNDSRREAPNSFTNPSYAFMANEENNNTRL